MAARRGPGSLTATDPRLTQLRDMSERGLTQADMARALGLSQQSVSRLLRYMKGLAPVAPRTERRDLAEMMHAENMRRGLRDEIYDAYHAGDSATVTQLWAQLSAT